MDKIKSRKGCLFVGLAVEDNIIPVDEYPTEDAKIRSNHKLLKARGGNASNRFVIIIFNEYRFVTIHVQSL